jgi:NAD(P)-dependent dehydrogenase (short-subunit alcohol dehydrogenase family)
MNAYVSGGSRGLGQALVEALVARGWTVVTDARHGPDLTESTAPIGDRVIALSGDVSDASHREQVREAIRNLGSLDLIVNNASHLGPSPQPHLKDYPLAELRRVYEVNLIAPLALIQVLLPHLSPGGVILNITSDAAVEGYEGWGGYGSSKAALEQLSRVLAAEHPALRVYWVDPGDMNTRMQQEAFPGEDVSDRPPPTTSVPGLMALIEGQLPSGRYQARAVVG